MRLKQIKLAGFKSFVDPTKVPFEQQMTAIVGPNGCGKSNIIDAVRWVLGESSAKNLRGDAMTDVIFNGAASRKPVGQASVELVFENVSGHLQDSMAQKVAERNEIAVRRLVSRDGTNSYFLNGSKCRRKDITDIFLGTGLGPRSYAIIEQGTISRLIESKPQELRVFIEEAAGISKYKERRRDTENRIRHTRENLERLSDIRAELALQIDKLHRQSEAAKRFKTLKASERKYKAELAVLRWQKFHDKQQAHLEQIAKTQQTIEDLVIQANKQDVELFQAKQSLSVDGESAGDLQKQKLALTNDIARTEQNIKHAKQQQIIAQQEVARAQQQGQGAEQESTAERAAQQESEALLQQLTPELTMLAETLEQAQASLAEADEQQRALQAQWREQQQANHKRLELTAQLTSKIDVCKSQLVSAEQQKSQLREQLNAMSSIDEQAEQLMLMKEELAEQQLQVEELTAKRSALNDEQQTHQTHWQQLQQALAQKQAQQTFLSESLQKLEAQQAEKSDWQQAQHDALVEQKNIEQKNIELTQAVSVLDIDTAWRSAVEMVLGEWLQASLVEQWPQSLPTTSLLVSEQNSEVAPPNTLAEKVSGSECF